MIEHARKREEEGCTVHLRLADYSDRLLG